MILAAASCGEGEGPPPRELQLAWQVRAWGVLPEGGGLLDQRAGELARMERALSVYEAFRGWGRARNWLKWREDHPQQWEIIVSVLKLRYERTQNQAGFGGHG